MNGEKKVRLTIRNPDDIEVILDYDEDGMLTIITQGGKEVSIDADQVYKFLKFIYGE